ncbi:MAG: exodeoxyribonuclease VII small subunit [Candidatus Riflebacteria bacterium]|nr:exodeoxyribonuclease VII small subunit [Candidatus Riflebacteria bacterium]
MKQRPIVIDVEKLVSLTLEEIASMPYETAMENLELVVCALEGEGTPLALGLKLYEIGTALGKKCGGDLDRTEARMVQLLGDAETAREEPFDPEKDGR